MIKLYIIILLDIDKILCIIHYLYSNILIIFYLIYYFNIFKILKAKKIFIM